MADCLYDSERTSENGKWFLRIISQSMLTQMITGMAPSFKASLNRSWKLKDDVISDSKIINAKVD